MNRRIYGRLALQNIRRNSKTYVPYMLTCVLTVTMFYLVMSLSCNPGLDQMTGAATLTAIMKFGVQVIGIFAFVFLFYTNSFLMKRRKKEFGLLNLLGMEKKHLSWVLLLETGVVTAVSLLAGLGLGIVLDKLMFLLICRIMGGEITLGFFLSPKALWQTPLFFCLVFGLIYANSVRIIQSAKPIALLQGSNVGEREPKAKWFLALLGVIALAVGYYLAVTVKDPLTSLNVFFVAVLLVIAATYLLFTAGSIAVLKLLRKNRRYYYQTRHFISVSGMLYRMKQNAVGLANICVLSTMVLVMVSSTTSLMLGMEDIIYSRYPNDISLYIQEPTQERCDQLVAYAETLSDQLDVPAVDVVQYPYLDLVASQQENRFILDEEQIHSLGQNDQLRALAFVPLSAYNGATGKSYRLETGKALICANRLDYEQQTLCLLDREYRIVGQAEFLLNNGRAVASVFTSYTVVLSEGDFAQLLQAVGQATGEELQVYYGFDTDAPESAQKEFCRQLTHTMEAEGFTGELESRVGQRAFFLGVYGGIYFLGIFLGLLFVMATVLIIYYKQISEGYEDRGRFAIMQKVGLSQEEVKRAIHSQVLTVFFLPLVVAGLHTAMAFPLIRLLLALFNMVNVRLYLLCTLGCFLAFGVLYVLIYSLTAKTYYKIVSQ